jgi:hypothetical protein
VVVIGALDGDGIMTEKQETLSMLNEQVFIAVKLIPLSEKQAHMIDFSTLQEALRTALALSTRLESMVKS